MVLRTSGSGRSPAISISLDGVGDLVVNLVDNKSMQPGSHSFSSAS